MSIYAFAAAPMIQTYNAVEEKKKYESKIKAFTSMT